MTRFLVVLLLALAVANPKGYLYRPPIRCTRSLHHCHVVPVQVGLREGLR